MSFFDTLIQVILIGGMLYLFYYWLREPFNKLFSSIGRVFGYARDKTEDVIIEGKVVSYT